MADEIKIPLDPFTDTGLTLLAKVYNSTGAQEGSTVAMSEDGPAVYIGDFALGAVADGQYMVRFETNTPDKMYGTGSLFVRNNAEVSQEQFFQQSEYTAPDNAGISALETKAQADIRQASLTSQHGQTQSDIAALPTPLTAAQVNAEVDTALSDYDCPTNAEMTAAFTEIKGAGWTTETLKDIRDNTGTVDLSSVTNALDDIKGATFNTVTDSLEAIRDRGDEAWTTGSGLSEAALHTGLDNYTNKNDFKADVSSLSTQASVDTIDSNVDAIKAKTDNLPTNPAAVSDIPTAAENALELLDNQNTV